MLVEICEVDVRALSALILMARYVSSSDMTFAAFVAWIENQTGMTPPADLAEGREFMMHIIYNWTKIQAEMKKSLG